MKILVIGGTGTVGSRVVTRLLQRDVEVRALTHSAARAASLPAPVEPFVGDLVEAPEHCAAAFADIDAVFMLNAATAHETVEGLLAVELARQAAVRRFVYQSVHRVEDLAHIPHLAPKLVIQRAVARSGMDHTFLCPNHFFQNDESCRDTILRDGTFVQPLGPVGLWRVDAGDIADAAAVALTTNGHGGRSYNLVGPQLLTGEDCAAAWSRALNRKITYNGDVNVWLQGVGRAIPPWLAFDIAFTHRGFVAEGMLGEASDVARLTELLGRPPRAYQAYVDERAAAWAR